MSQKNTFLNKLSLLLGVFLLFATNAEAATRTIYFDGSTFANTANGFSSAQNAKCTILIKNPSQYSQTLSALTIYASAAGTPAGNATTPTGFTLTGSKFTLNASVVLPASGTAGDALKYEFLYPSMPANTPANQTLSCRGEITALDTTASTPGFMVANAIFTTISETSVMQTSGSTNSTTYFKGNAVYTQIPISINRGKPF